MADHMADHLEDRRPVEFGKRRPLVPAPAQPAAKRSSHVALLLMGTLAVGGSAYALMPRQTCGPTSPDASAPAMAAPALLQTANASCSSSSSHGSSGGSRRSSRLSFFGGDSSSNHSSSAASSDAGSGGVTRGGFGGLAHAFGFSGHG
jgi:hypothetical protein